MKKRIISREEVEGFNEMRKSHQEPMSTSEVLNLLGQLNFKGARYLKVMVQLGILKKLGFGKYKFCENPVYIEKLQNCVRESSKQACARKNKPSKEIPQADSEQIAIDLLKSLGYRISQPQFDVEAAMKHPELPVKNFLKYIVI